MNQQDKNSGINALISIIVPVYNVERYLDKCIMSILAQTYENLEIILVDDGSSDKSSEICDLFAEKDLRILVIHQHNKGLSAARNVGIEHAKGEYLAFVDGDDYISPLMIEHLYSRIVLDQADIAICGYRKVDEEGRELSVATIPDAVVSGVQAIKMHYQNTSGIMLMPVNKIYAKKLFESIRFPIGKVHEDEAIFYRVLDLCERVSILAEPLYSYVQHEDSIMGRGYSVERLDGVEAFYERFLFYRDHGDKYQDLLQTEGEMFIWLFYDVIRQFRPHTREEKERVREIYSMARTMYSQQEISWSFRERIKLRFPELYLCARRIKDIVLKNTSADS